MVLLLSVHDLEERRRGEVGGAGQGSRVIGGGRYVRTYVEGGGETVYCFFVFFVTVK
jgi:hypothetical protein